MIAYGGVPTRPGSFCEQCLNAVLVFEACCTREPGRVAPHPMALTRVRWPDQWGYMRGHGRTHLRDVTCTDVSFASSCARSTHTHVTILTYQFNGDFFLYFVHTCGMMTYSEVLAANLGSCTWIIYNSKLSNLGSGSRDRHQ